MRLKKLVVMGSVAALILLLCAAMIMDRKIAEQQLESVIATDTVLRTNVFATAQMNEVEETLPAAPISYASLPLPEEVAVVESAAAPQTAIPTSVQESVPTDGFLLKIRNTKISVGYDTSEEALKKRPGWLSTSAYPGEEGVCIIYGHRNRKHLRALEKAEIGDEITIITEGEITFTYTICDTYVVDDLSDIALTSTDDPTLVLMTCYPFRYSGSAPQKYVVIAKKEGLAYE